RAALGGGLDEHVSVEVLSREGHEELAADAAAGVRRHAVHGDVGGRAAQAAPGRGGDLLDGEAGVVRRDRRRHQSFLPRRSASARRASTRSSKARFSAPTIWYGSCPLPASKTRSPGFASRIARSMARVRSSTISYGIPEARSPGSIAAAIAWGSSE